MHNVFCLESRFGHRRSSPTDLFELGLLTRVIMLLETERYALIRRKIGHSSPPPVSVYSLLMGSRDSLLVRVPDS